MGILDLVFPKECLDCNKEGVYICRNCISKVRFAKPICPECQKPSIDGFTHIKCQRKLGLNGLISVWNYEGIMRKAVLSLKYKYATDIADELSGYVLQVLKRKRILVPNNYYLVPIPMHWYRENSRGFNQSETLAEKIANGMNWKFFPDLLVRKKLTTPQVQLKGEDRRKNIKGVFALNPNYYSLLPSASFLVFDDVYTTGSTLKEAAKVLKRAGAEKVWGLTIAR